MHNADTDHFEMVDWVLTVTATGLDVYEIGCDLGKSVRLGKGMRFDAQCYKGGSPVRPGKVVMQRRGPDEVDLILEGFSWISAKPQSYRRC
jgi:hypothetical protein